MKKFLIVLTIMLGIVGIAQARDHYERTDASLPEAAKVTLSKNFKAKVSLVKIEKNLGIVHEYEVHLTDETEVSFDSKGNWESIETAANKSVPSSLVPKPIADYVASNYKKTKIISIDKERDGYDVELNNGIDLKFDMSGKFKRFD